MSLQKMILLQLLYCKESMMFSKTLCGRRHLAICERAASKSLVPLRPQRSESVSLKTPFASCKKTREGSRPATIFFYRHGKNFEV